VLEKEAVVRLRQNGYFHMGSVYSVFGIEKRRSLSSIALISSLDFPRKCRLSQSLVARFTSGLSNEERAEDAAE